jgi:taurine dioxygenase
MKERPEEKSVAYTTIDVKPISGALGAEINGVDLARPLDNEVFSEVHQAFLDHQVIFFRDQRLTPEQHLDFSRMFGELNRHAYVKGLEGFPEIMELRKEKEETENFGGLWHSDVTFLEKPALGSVLYGREIPECGGDTLFANMYLAYETLSPGMKNLLAGLTAMHSASHFYGRRSGFYRDSGSMRVKHTEEAETEVEHPVVRTHPETGRKALYVNSAFTVRFAGMSEQESKPLLTYLYEHAARPEFTCRFRWRKDSMAFWDNRCTQHYALNDYHGHRRVMHRVTINGDRPF